MKTTKMKRLQIVLLAAVVILLSVSCEKRLDMKPTQSIDETEALKKSSDVEAALIGAYSDIGDDDVLGGGFLVRGELLANVSEINWSGTFQELTQIYNKAIPINNFEVAETWVDTYRAINTINNVLGAIDTVIEVRRDRVEGEAKFLRGLLYYQLVTHYAKSYNDGNPEANPGVPLILAPTRAPITDSNKVARASVAAVYQQILADLEEAAELLQDDEDILDNQRNYFGSKASALGLLSRVYLQIEDYEKAWEAANTVIEEWPFELTDSYRDAFPVNYTLTTSVTDATSEDIFALRVNSTQGTNDLNTFFSPLGRGDMTVNQSFIDQFEPTDDRLSLYEYDSDADVYLLTKFDMIYSPVKILRLAEMYLTRAEASFRLGTGDMGLADVNMIRERAGLDPLDAADLTLEAIVKERRLELAFEGGTLQDVKRLKGSVGNIQWNSSRLILPIPSREITVNPNLTQNEGY
jgi:starch-binding outer membrane protein, SusD/RagB family